MEKLTISILICSKNRFDSLRDLVGHLRMIKAKDQKLEIVVVEEVENPEPIEDTIYYPLPTMELGFGYARQQAIEKSTGSILVFIDDDCIPLSGWLTSLLNPFSNEDVSAVGGGILPQNCRSIGKAIALLGFPAGGIAKILKSGDACQESRNLSTGNLALRAEAVKKVGGFSLSHKYGGEDQELVRALPGKCLFQPRALVYHKQRDNIQDILKWFVRRGKAQYFINRDSNMGRLSALLYPIRWSWWWRLLFLVALGLFFGIIPLISLIICYYLFVALRVFTDNRQQSVIQEVENTRRQILRIYPLLLVPIVRTIMDLGREVGRISAMLDEMKRE